jgi:hypothetical protein
MLTKGSLQMSNNLSDYDDRLIVVRGRVKELMGDNKSGFDCVFTDCVWQPIGKADRPLAESPLGTSRNILARIGREEIFRWKLDNPGGPMDRKCEYVFDVVVRDGAFVGLDRVRDWRLASPLIGELKWLRKSHEGVPPQEAFNELTRFVASAFGCPQCYGPAYWESLAFILMAKPGNTTPGCTSQRPTICRAKWERPTAVDDNHILV